MKVIFLDIDGVLNCDATNDRAPSGCIGIDDSKVSLLAKIVERTGAIIVLTSTWKSEWSREPDFCSKDCAYLNQKLSAVGLTIAAKTSDQVVNRGSGISAWLSNKPDVDGWVVLDDDIFADYHRYGIMQHLVHTKYRDGGLRLAHIEEAVRILNEGR